MDLFGQGYCFNIKQMVERENTFAELMRVLEAKKYWFLARIS